MNVQALNLLSGVPGVKSLDLNIGKNGTAANAAQGTSFDSFFQTFMDLYKDTNTSIQEAGNMQLDFAQGKTDDILGLTMAMEKASTSLNFTVQVTNKILDAYREIMRMQM